MAQNPGYKGISYTAPPGWTSGERDGQLLFVPSDITDATAVVVVLRGAESLGGASFADWFRTRLASDAAGAKVLRDSPVQTGASGNLQVLSTGRTIQDASGGVRLQIFYGITDGTQGGTAMLLTASETALTKYLPAIQRFFATLRFAAPATAPGPAIAPAPAPAPAAAGSGAPGTFQNVIYTVPPGWSVREDGAVVLSPQGNLQGDETLDVVILPGKVAANLEQEFQTTWREVVAMLNAESMRNVSGAPFDLEGVARSTSGWEFLRGSGGARNAQRRFTVSLFLAKVGDRIERVAMIAREIQVNLTTASALTNPRFSGAIDELLFGLRFGNWKTPTFADARLTGGPITGVWLGISMFGGKLTTGSAVFLSDGSAWFGGSFPTHGLDGVKPHIASGADRRRWGRYRFEAGATGTLTMGNGEIPLKLDGSALVLTTNKTPHRFVRSHPHASGRLNGRYCLTTGAGCVSFTADGQFRDEGAVRVVGHEVYPYPMSPARGQGTYQIRDYTLVLTYERGSEVRIAFPGFVDRAAAQSPSPDEILLSFNMDALRRQ